MQPALSPTSCNSCDMARCSLMLCLSLGSIEALLTSRLPASRFPAAQCVRNLPFSMCEGVADEAAALPVEDVVTDLSGVVDAPEDAEQKQRRRAPREPRTPVEELEVGSTVEGTVRSVQSYGAFVNIGIAHSAPLLSCHQSQHSAPHPQHART